MEPLPCEIVSKILSQLDVLDWIQCIQVSRSWFVMIPMAVSDLWNHVSIDKDTYPCLVSVRRFPSVQSICVNADNSESTLYAALQHVATCQVSFLELKRAQIDNERRFFKVLEILSRHLKSLTLSVTSTSFLDFPRILNTCPRLFHFGYTSDLYIQFDSVKDHLSSLDFHPNLVSLSLYTGQAHYDLLPILQSCPNLRALKLDVVMPLDCRQILETAPAIQYLHIGCFSILADVEWNPKEENKSDEEGLRYLCLEYYKNNSVSNSDWALQRYQHILQVLHVEYIDPDFSELHFDQLRVLSCRGNNTAEDNSTEKAGLGDLLNNCPNIHVLDLCDTNGGLTQSVVNAILRLSSLETASFLLVNQHETRTQRDQLVQSLAQLPRLTKLDIQIEMIGQGALDAISHISTLQELYLESSRRSLSVSLEVLSTIKALRFLGLTRFGNFSVEALSFLRQLETICLEHCRSIGGLLIFVDKAPPRLREVTLVECSGFDASMKAVVECAGKQRIEVIVHRKRLDHLRG